MPKAVVTCKPDCDWAVSSRKDLQELGLANCIKRVGHGNWMSMLYVGNLANSYSRNETHKTAELLLRLTPENSRAHRGRRSAIGWP